MPKTSLIAWMAANLVGWLADISVSFTVLEHRLRREWWGKDKLSLSCRVYLLDCDINVRIPAEFCTLYMSLSLSSSQALTQTVLCHFFSFSLPSSNTLTFFHFCLSLSVSCWYALLSFSICTLSFISPMWCVCHSWDAYLSFSLSLTVSLNLWLPLWLSVSISLYVSLCLPLPPTLLTSLCLHHAFEHK